MRKSTFPFGFALLLSALAIAATERTSAAGTLVTVTFSGTGFDGWFTYDQGKGNAGAGQFPFGGSVYYHELFYRFGLGDYLGGSGNQWPTFTITTSGNGYHTFTLTATAGGTTVTIVLPTNPNITLSSTSLPLCMSGSYQVFPNSPVPAGSTFTKSGGSAKAITADSCSLAAFAPVAPAPVVEICPPTPGVGYTYTSYTYPQYVSPPRRSCCLFGLFARRSHTRFGW